MTSLTILPLCSWDIVCVPLNTIRASFPQSQVRQRNPVSSNLTQSWVYQARRATTGRICVYLGIRQTIQHELFPSALRRGSCCHLPCEHLPCRSVRAIAWSTEVEVDVPRIGHPRPLRCELFPHDDVEMANPWVHSTNKFKVPPIFHSGDLETLTHHGK